MTKREKLLETIRNNPRDVRFDDLVRLVKALGFVADRQAGSHSIFVHSNPAVPFINLQEGKNGKAKPYQVEQVLVLVDAHNLEV
jgi:predicted RNA binding protein YcfA (HicA-like mRNA interferase family)